MAQGKPAAGMPKNVLGIIRSPVLEGYRNKSEMTIGLGVGGEQVRTHMDNKTVVFQGCHGKPATVGLRAA